VADVNGTHNRKLANKKGLAVWSIGKPPHKSRRKRWRLRAAAW